MFIDRTALLRDNPNQLNYGAAVTDVDGDGAFEIVVAGFGFSNQVLKWQGDHFADITPERLRDANRQSIGVAAADFDGDGREEIYVLNTDTFAGAKQVGDRLFDWRDGWVDLFELPFYDHLVNKVAGRSVVAVDRMGEGRYGFFVANYGGPMRLYEWDRFGTISDVARAAGLNYATGGRGVVALPIVSPRMDIVAVNERGPNLLFRNRGDGTFDEIAQEVGLADRREHGRGITAFDANDDGMFDLAYGNWEGPHRLFVQQPDGMFVNIAPPAMEASSRIRTVIAADFDNDGQIELFYNNIGEPNRLFGQRSNGWEQLDIGAAQELFGLGTGATIGDFDGDGRLELLICHGESGLQPLTYYHTAPNTNHWLRILPLTRYGAPARGSIVRLTAAGRTQIRTIDAGSGYLCQMEPVAHFGLGTHAQVDRIEVRWLDGTTAELDDVAVDQQITIPHPARQ